MEAEAAELTDVADVAVVIERPERARRVLDHPEAVIARDRHDRIHVRRQAEEVDRDDPDGAGRDLRLDLRDVDVEGLEVDVAEDRARPHVLDHVGRRHPGEGRNDHLVPWLQPECCDGQVERGRARACGQRVPDAGEFLELALELPHHRSLDQPAAAQRALDRLDLLLADERPGDRQLPVLHAYRARPATGMPIASGRSTVVGSAAAIGTSAATAVGMIRSVGSTAAPCQTRA